MNRDPYGHAASGLRKYVRQVARMLGDEVGTIDCDTELVPAMAMIVVRSRLPTLVAQELALTWDEVNGWATRIAVDESGETVALAYLGGDLLADPVEVAAFLWDSLAGHHPGSIFPPCFRGLGADDDLEIRLAQFA